MPRRPIFILAIICLLAAIAIGVGTMVATSKRDGDKPRYDVATGQPLVGGDFTLTDQNGKTVDQSILKGKWSLVFFGFTYCPDYCPTTLGVLNAVQQQLGDKAKDLQIVFISVDPERDTPQMLRDYLSSDGFPKGVIGLTGTPEQLQDVSKKYRAFYQKVGEGEGYTMNHSLTIYLMGPDGEYRAALAHDLGPKRSTDMILQEMARD